MATTSSNNAQRIAAIDLEVNDYCGKLASLRRERNSLVPIFCVPDDILHQIFLEYALDSGHGTIFDMKFMVVISCICRRWSLLLQNHRALFSYIHIGNRYSINARKITQQLNRSGLHPLTVEISTVSADSAYWTYAQAPQIASEILEPTSCRIASLHMKFGRIYPSTLVQLISTWPLPMMTSFELSCPFNLDIDAQPEALSTIMRENAPCLSSLKLTIEKHILFDWEAPHHLVQLSVTMLADSVNFQRPRLEELLAALNSSPTLESIELINCIRLDCDETYDMPTVHLPALRSLVLSSDIRASHRLLSHIHIPSTATLHIFVEHVTTVKRMAKLLVLCRKHLVGAGALPIKKVVSNATHQVVQIECFTTSNSTYPSFLLHVHPASRFKYAKLSIRLFRTLPFDATTHLLIHGDCYQRCKYPQIFASILGFLPALHELHVFDDAAGLSLCNALLDALRRETLQIASTDKLTSRKRAAFQNWLLPRIRSLFLHPASPNDTGYHNVPLGFTSVAEMYQMRGTPFETVHWWDSTVGQYHTLTGEDIPRGVASIVGNKDGKYGKNALNLLKLPSLRCPHCLLYNYRPDDDIDFGRDFGP